MATEWTGWINVIAHDYAVASGLAALIDPDTGGAETFSNGLKLRPIGSAVTDPTAWAAAVPLKQLGVDTVLDALNGVVHGFLAERGITAPALAAAVETMDVECGARATYEANLLAFIAANGLEVIPSPPEE